MDTANELIKIKETLLTDNFTFITPSIKEPFVINIINIGISIITASIINIISPMAKTFKNILNCENKSNNFGSSFP